MEMKSGGIPNVGFRNRWERTESYQPSPTQEQVDTYIRALEWQALLEDFGIPPRHAEKHRAAGRGRGAFVSSRFFWGLIAMALGCIAWLFQIIYEGLK
jgi:hypothetical protein